MPESKAPLTKIMSSTPCIRVRIPLQTAECNALLQNRPAQCGSYARPWPGKFTIAVLLYTSGLFATPEWLLTQWLQQKKLWITKFCSSFKTTLLVNRWCMPESKALLTKIMSSTPCIRVRIPLQTTECNALLQNRPAQCGSYARPWPGKFTIAILLYTSGLFATPEWLLTQWLQQKKLWITKFCSSFKTTLLVNRWCMPESKAPLTKIMSSTPCIRVRIPLQTTECNALLQNRPPQCGSYARPWPGKFTIAVLLYTSGLLATPEWLLTQWLQQKKIMNNQNFAQPSKPHY